MDIASAFKALLAQVLAVAAAEIADPAAAVNDAHTSQQVEVDLPV